METLFDLPDVAPFILVVDNEVSIVEEVIDLLSQCNIQCRSAVNAETALTILEEEPDITVLLTDIDLPGMNGLTLATNAQAARTDDAALEVVVLTAHSTVSHLTTALQVRAFDFIAKPVSFATLMEPLTRAHREAARRRQLLAETRQLRAMLDTSIINLKAGLAESKPDANCAERTRNTVKRVLHREILTALHQILGFADLIGITCDPETMGRLSDYTQPLSVAGIHLAEQTKMLVGLTEKDIVPTGSVFEQTNISDILDKIVVQVRRDATVAARHVISCECPDRLTFVTDPAALTGAVLRMVHAVISSGRSSGHVKLIASKITDGLRIVATDGAGDLSTALSHLQEPDIEATALKAPNAAVALGVAALHAIHLGGRLMVAHNKAQRTALVIDLPAEEMAEC